jgi:hypothetical protein
MAFVKFPRDGFADTCIGMVASHGTDEDMEAQNGLCADCASAPKCVACDGTGISPTSVDGSVECPVCEGSGVE